MTQEHNKINPLVKLYGDTAFDIATTKIHELAKKSDIPFEQKYIKLGKKFTLLNAQEIIEGKTKERTLKDLITKSFGEAAMYKYNVIDGVL